MREATFAELTVRITGGTDGAGGGSGPMVVLLHGFGAPGTDLVALEEALRLPNRFRFAFPEAPISLGDVFGFDSRAWWMIDMLGLQEAVHTGRYDELARIVPAGIAEAREQLGAMLSELSAACDVPTGGLVLGGFSQGAMLSCDLALQNNVALGGLILMSGSLLNETQWARLAPSRAGLAVLQSHGQRDPVLPFALAKRLERLLSSAGLLVRFMPFDGAHAIPPNVLVQLRSFLSELELPR